MELRRWFASPWLLPTSPCPQGPSDTEAFTSDTREAELC